MSHRTRIVCLWTALLVAFVTVPIGVYYGSLWFGGIGVLAFLAAGVLVGSARYVGPATPQVEADLVNPASGYLMVRDSCVDSRGNPYGSNNS